MTKNQEISDRLPQPSPREQGYFDQKQSNHNELSPKRLREHYPSGVLGAVRFAFAKYSRRAETSPSPSSGSHSSNYNTQQLAKSKLSSPPPQQSRMYRSHKPGFSIGWQFWAVLVLLTSGGLGFVATALLLKLPSVPNCPKIFWPTASASMRLYCSQVAASKQTSKDLLEAIALVDTLPNNHPLRPEINRNIEEWSLDILNIGEQSFHAGDLEEAIKIARAIPEGVSAYKLVEDRIERWQTIWSKAEKLYSQAEYQLRQSNWNQAFREAVALTYVENKYWSSFKYDQLSDNIQIAQKESEKLDKAFNLSRSGSLENLLAAIAQAEQIPPKSYAYKEARDLIAKCGDKLIKIASQRLEERNGAGVLEIANKLPASLNRPQMRQDLMDLGLALSASESGTVWDLEEAIASVQKLDPNRPLYKSGQKLIDRWQREIQDIATLERARAFANTGLTTDLRTAIAEARQVPRNNPRYQEARTEIERWTYQVQTIEDKPYLERAIQLASYGGAPYLREAVREASRVGQGRALYQDAQSRIGQWNQNIQRIEDQPYLERANQLARSGSIPALQAAVQEASRIAPGRLLYQEAQARIKQWVNSIQRTEDQPYLNQARTLAYRGDLATAISTAARISSGRVLYPEAQRNIKIWQTELEGKRILQEAYRVSSAGTPEALKQAILVARQVPTSAQARSEVVTMVNRWSNQILAMAQDRSSFDLASAIAIAKMVPSGTRSYQQAQGQIQAWQDILKPPPVILEPQPRKNDQLLEVEL
ncbi:MAG: chromosome segregation ATPase [Symploca sp. SIO1C4]|uniref:Chromosome segregation ATPase n=1 Tax=Symploca sp. SIO1C4 TaxID=2607765 RepID=A0A6B3NEK3_9CYAN|nr:chromosome segregation ATPase [Symploca sp. SIO1C4]NET05740.1 chromosome segregation ATPase [Symploca sp. SIO2B6]